MSNGEVDGPAKRLVWKVENSRAGCVTLRIGKTQLTYKMIVAQTARLGS
jgi:hypothetical protein